MKCVKSFLFVLFCLLLLFFFIEKKKKKKKKTLFKLIIISNEIIMLKVLKDRTNVNLKNSCLVKC